MMIYIASISELIIFNKNTRLQSIFLSANDFKPITWRIEDILYLLLIDVNDIIDVINFKKNLGILWNHNFTKLMFSIYSTKNILPPDIIY